MALTPQNIQLIGMMVIYLIVALEFYMVIWWIRKHKYLINLYEFKSGAMVKSSVRYRVVEVKIYAKPTNILERFKPKLERTENKFYKRFDMFKRGKSPFVYDEIKDSMLLREGNFLSAKYEINITQVGEAYKSWVVCKADKEIKDITKNTEVVWIDHARQLLHDYTKADTTNKDLLLKILLPMGVIILAIILVVFFPKMYAAVTSGGNAAASSAVNKWSEMIGQFIPRG